jgi:glycosyltransferase involved in cell wall biosynthesis
MSKPRILIIENSIAITGALKSIIRSSQGLASEYTFIFLLPTNSTATKHVSALGFEVHELPMKELRKSILSLIAYFPSLLYNSIKLFKIIRNHKINLITGNDFYNLLPVGYKILGGNLPYLCYVRFLPSKFPAPLVKFWCALHHRYASTTIAVSEVVKNELPYKEHVVVIGNELPAEEIPFHSALSSTTILYPANYIQGKGQEFALESFSLIFRKHPRWKLKFVGGDMGLQKNKDFKENLIALANRFEFANQVEWHNFSDKVSDEYLNAGIVLNFSESESFSMTCLEAMFYGRPVIATRSGGPSEIIDQNETGILVDVKDVTAMAHAMEYLISNPDKRESMARRGYNKVRLKFSYANTVQKLGDVYQMALKDYSPKIL